MTANTRKNTEKRLAFLHALTALHCGTGQGVGSIDLPIARERATNIPIVPGTSIKGCLRDGLDLDAPVTQAIFGPERGSKEEDKYSGSLRVSDAQLLLLPVRCLAATFVWTTCPFVLHRLRRDAQAAGLTSVPTVIPSLNQFEARVASADPLITLAGKKRLVLEESDFDGQQSGAEEWCIWIADRLFPNDPPWQEEFRKRFAIVDDVSFDHLAEFATEVNAHIAIDDKTGTVADGALWYQEALPAESVLTLLLHAEKPRRPDSPVQSAADVLAHIPLTSSVQFGGKATTGMGVARLVPVGGAQ